MLSKITQKPRKLTFGKKHDYLTLDPPRSLHLWCSFLKTVNTYPRSAPFGWSEGQITYSSLSSLPVPLVSKNINQIILLFILLYYSLLNEDTFFVLVFSWDAVFKSKCLRRHGPASAI